MELTQIQLIALFILSLSTSIYSLILKRRLIFQRENFIHTLAHDFKVPLLAQSNSLKLLTENPNVELIKDINSAYECTLSLIEMLSMNLKFENKDYKLNKINFNFNNELLKILEQTSIEADSKNIDFYYQIPNNTIINADINCFKKVLNILVNMSISYAYKNTKIYFYLFQDNKEVKLMVNYERNKYIEKEFMDAEKYLSLKLHSVGEMLKLDFCNKVLKAHGGTFKVLIYEKMLKSLLITIPVTNKCYSDFKQQNNALSYDFCI